MCKTSITLQGSKGVISHINSSYTSNPKLTTMKRNNQQNAAHRKVENKRNYRNTPQKEKK